MIFITTGSSQQSVFYKPLIKKIEQLKRDGLLEDRVVVQAGDAYFESPYIEEIFDYTTEFEGFIDRAEIVITAEGAGTLFCLLTAKKKIIVVPNELALRYSAPVADLTGKFEEMNYLICCKDPAEILVYINAAKNKDFGVYQKPKNDIAKRITMEYERWIGETV